VDRYGCERYNMNVKEEGISRTVESQCCAVILLQSQVCAGPILVAIFKRECTFRYHIRSLLQILRQALYYLLQMEMLVA
jgi:hypothetical protein